MALWDDLVANAQSAVNTVGKRTNELIDVSKLRLNIAEVGKKITAEYTEIGRLFCEGKKQEADVSTEMEEHLATVEELNAQMDALNERLLELKKTVKCPNCGTENTKDNLFCPKCGAKL